MISSKILCQVKKYGVNTVNKHSQLKHFSSFHYQELFDLNHDNITEYRKISSDFISTEKIGNYSFLKVEPKALELLTFTAMSDIAHLLRPAHLQQLANILKDSEATSNDKVVALELLKNANIASHFVLPGCQDTGTAIVSGMISPSSHHRLVSSLMTHQVNEVYSS